MSKPSRRPHLAAFVVGAIVLASCTAGDAAVSSPSSTEPDPTSLAPSTTVAPVATTTEAPSTTATAIDSAEWLAERVAKIEAMVVDRNSGDFDAWRSHYIAERPNIFGGTVVDDSDLEWQRSFMAANEIWTITGECQAAGANQVSCPFTLENDFHGSAGIFFTVPALTFGFDDDLHISAMSARYWEHAEDPAVFNGDFDAWLAEAHPDVHAGFGPRVEGEDGLPNPEDMPTALEYVAEFIEQSDDYPVPG